ncbi:MAG: DUF2760 domain-containing protein [Gemmataceae bacterium]|nr:DUF2760 domain-containing protein [Gemmata sp.]MDW8197591.1 DUF2760 domain-containing protein [Gemmataceae bacterium]
MQLELAVGLALGVMVGILAMVGWAIAQAGSLGRAIQGLTVARRASRDAAFAAKLQAILAGAEVKQPEPPQPPRPSGAPLRLLALLQAEARLVDFLLEDIHGASDEQIGQAVREVHKKAQAALKQHLVLEQVLPGQEDETVTIPPGFDPSAIRVVGNVTGHPPFTGTIQHPGWRVKEIKLTPPAEGVDEFVLQPAEVFIP